MAQLIQQNPQGPHVDFMIVRLVVDHLGSHVLQRAAESVALLIGILFNTPAEIANFDRLVLTDQQIFRLEVPMDEPIMM